MKLLELAKVVLILGLLVWFNTRNIPDTALLAIVLDSAPSSLLGVLGGLLTGAVLSTLGQAPAYFAVLLSMCATFLSIEPWAFACLYTQTLVVLVSLAFKKENK